MAAGGGSVDGTKFIAAAIPIGESLWEIVTSRGQAIEKHCHWLCTNLQQLGLETNCFSVISKNKRWINKVLLAHMFILIALF